jgi:cephalosporin hydroxylase
MAMLPQGQKDVDAESSLTRGEASGKRNRRRRRSRRMNLWSDFLTNQGRPIHKWKHYFPVYERHFRDYMHKTVTFIEIGCGEGGSLQMWKRYFGPHARIVGLDIDPQCKQFEEDQIDIRIGAEQDPEFLRSVIEEFGTPDIVLDDGSHVMSHVCASFAFLYPRLAKSGIYMVEDLHTAYWPEYEGGLGRPGSFIELAKQLIDQLNADHIRDGLAPTEFTRTTMAMHFYDSAVVFERGRHTEKAAPKTGRSAALPA